MRIAVIGHKKVPSRLGGIEIHVEELSKRMADDGHVLDIYNRSIYGKAEIGYPGIVTRIAWTLKNKSLEALVYSITASIQVMFGRYDIVHYHALGPCVMSFLPRLAGKKVVTTLHGLDWQRGKWGMLASAYLKFGEYAACHFSHETISVSESLIPYLENKHGRSIRYIPNGISRAPERRTGEDDQKSIFNRLLLEPDGYFLFVSRLVKEKGCHYLIEAFQMLDTTKMLVIAGDSPYDPEYQAALRSMASEDPRILFAGHVEADDLHDLYRDAYAYILPSDIEGLPLTLLEAMSFGKLCVVSDIPENTVVLGVHGLSFRRGDINHLSEVLQRLVDGDLPNAEGFGKEEMLEYVHDRYDWDKVAKQTEDIYQSLQGQKRDTLC